MRLRSTIVMLAFFATGCFVEKSGTRQDSGGVRLDAGAMDGGRSDSGSVDAATDDAGSDAGTTDAGPGDDAGPPDSGSGDLLIEAEDYDATMSLDSVHNWVREATHTGFSGGGYVTTVPGSPYAGCDEGELGDCGALVRYDFAVGASAMYELHFSTTGPGPGSNSIWWAFDSTTPANLGVADSDIWNWHRASAGEMLAPGGHTLTVYMRENGMRIDRIFITSMGTTPP